MQRYRPSLTIQRSLPSLEELLDDGFASLFPASQGFAPAVMANAAAAFEGLDAHQPQLLVSRLEGGASRRPPGDARVAPRGRLRRRRGDRPTGGVTASGRFTLPEVLNAALGEASTFLPKAEAASTPHLAERSTLLHAPNRAAIPSKCHTPPPK